MDILILRTLDNGSYQCQIVDDPEIWLEIKPESFPVTPYRGQTFVITVEGDDIKIDAAPPQPDAHPEIKQRIKQLVERFTSLHPDDK